MLEENMVELKKIINNVQDYVEKEKFAYIIPEHLFFILLDDKKCQEMIRELSENKDMVDQLKLVTEIYVHKVVETTSDISNITPTSAYSKIIQNTVAQSAMRSLPPTSLTLFSNLFIEKDSNAAVVFLTSANITEERVREYVKKKRNESPEISNESFNKYAINLNDIAKSGKIDPLIGRKKEVERLIQVLAKRRSNNPIIVGVEGCGKSAIVEGLALKIVNNEVPESVKDKIIYTVDMAGMLAGTRYRGEFEERLQTLIKEVVGKDNVILFIDEIHNLVGAGSNDGTFDASNILKPYLAKGELHLIGATTYDEYKSKILKDKAFARRFKKVDCVEPNKDETFEIIKGLKKYYQEFHKVDFSDEVLKYIVELSERFIHDRFFPDKAVDVMDELGAKYHSGLKQGTEATKEDVEEIIAGMANIPKLSVEFSEKEKLKNLAATIKENLFGQDEIVDKIVKQIHMSKAGLSNQNRPLCVNLLSGATGVGKTELAKQIANALNINFVKLDMSEYSEEYAVSRLIGSSAGYVGYEQAGALTEPLIKNPHSVVLLDEIEKANDAVYNLLLQVFDEGKLTDNHGREASFKNAIILLTSNVGCREAENTSKSMGFISTDKQYQNKQQKILEEELKSTFSPEFRNRLNNIFYFNALDEQSMSMIVDKNIKRINQALVDKNVKIEIKDEAKKWIVNKSFKENAGGRPVERIINSEITEKLSEEILFGKLENGGNVKVTLNKKDDNISLIYS